MTDSAVDSGRHRRMANYRRTLTIRLTLVLTAAQFWAITAVLLQFRAEGTARIALAVTLAGAVLAIVDGWSDVRILAHRTHRMKVAQSQQNERR